MAADVNNVDAHGQTPLHDACLKGHTETVKLLLARGGSGSKWVSSDAVHLLAALSLVPQGSHGVDAKGSDRWR